MIERLCIERLTANGKYADVLDAAELLAAGSYGSATNAVVVMARQSPLFREAQAQLQREKARTGTTEEP